MSGTHFGYMEYDKDTNAAEKKKLLSSKTFVSVVLEWFYSALLYAFTQKQV